ncbi:uncharacterized protein LOC103716691 [Phoenix dactylifera]|uniref:Uncharacterized protein LOC103716691 n=1 Tax=Phoenix dactylifera TaxID=42345 RepID=A0A8B7CNW3_PHODC|nr:uncharacterized protein LOC103716691 [Phoenix dactylifera]
MESIQHFMIILVLIGILSAYQYKAQSSGGSMTPARSLDALLQDYAYRAFVHPHTGRPYDGQVPSNITGIKIAALRLRSGSLRRKGVPGYKEFQIPTGVIVRPYVKRLVLVYQNLGNWSSTYYNLPGYTHLTPVLGLLAYDAANLSATNLPELTVVVSKSPILINFTDARPVPAGLSARCVYFNLVGLPVFRELVSSNVCSTSQQGHFSIVVNASSIAPPPAPRPGHAKGNKSKVWKIVGAVVGGFIALVLLALLVAWMFRYRQERKMADMERHADVGEALQMARVGNTQAPVALGTRTQPVLENEYVA